MSRRWRTLETGERRRTRQPGQYLLVPSTLIRSWVWPHREEEHPEDELVAVEIEGNVPVGGGEVYRRLLEDGRVIVVSPQLFSVLITIGPFEGDHYDEGWRFAYVEDALEAARVWDGKGDPPGPFNTSHDEGGDRLIMSCWNSGLMPVSS